MAAPSPVKSAFGLALREYRNAKDMTLEGLSLEAGVGPKFIWQIENGLTGATIETLFKLAGALSVDPAALITRSQAFLNEMPPAPVLPPSNPGSGGDGVNSHAVESTSTT